MKRTLNIMTCEGRHPIPKADDGGIFPMVIERPTDGEWMRKHAEELKRLVHEHEEQRLDVIMAWRDAGEAVALAFRLVNRAKAAMDRQEWWFRFEEYRRDEDEQDNNLFQVHKGLTLAKRGIEEMVQFLRAVEFPNTFVD